MVLVSITMRSFLSPPSCFYELIRPRSLNQTLMRHHPRLPGAKRGDMSARGQRPEVRVAELQFSPTGRDFAATTTEGLLIYSLDSKLVFDPFELNVDITPATIRAALKREDHGAALVMSLR